MKILCQNFQKSLDKFNEIWYYIVTKRNTPSMEITTMTNKGYNEMTGLYTTRYYAKKVATGDDVVVNRWWIHHYNRK